MTGSSDAGRRAPRPPDRLTEDHRRRIETLVADYQTNGASRIMFQAVRLGGGSVDLGFRPAKDPA